MCDFTNNDPDNHVLSLLDSPCAGNGFVYDLTCDECGALFVAYSRWAVAVRCDVDHIDNAVVAR